MAEVQQKRLVDEYQGLQDELKKNIENRQKLEAQQQENKNVQKEFAKLNDSSKIYKLVGPVLLKQDHAEAVMAVDSRLDYISKEITRIEGLITATQQKSENKKAEIIQLQSQLQGPAESA